MDKNLENYNLINYLKIIDLSLLNLFDYMDIENSQYVLDSKGRIILNLNPKTRDLLETLLISNINNSIYYNKVNIIVNTCLPKDNWHNIEQIIDKPGQKYIVIDDSIYVDTIKMNMFFDNFFKKIEKNNIFGNKRTSIALSNNVKFICFKSIDIYDTFYIVNSILSNFGIIKKDNFNYNLIRDGNNDFMHGTSFVSELYDEVRLMLMNKGII